MKIQQNCITASDKMQDNKLTKKWIKGYDFMDDSPRYTFEERDTQDTLSTIRVVIYQESEPEYQYSGKKVKVYYGHVENNRTETADTIGSFQLLSIAKRETEKLFYEYCKLFPSDIN